jgi:hypothetical protein
MYCAARGGAARRVERVGAEGMDARLTVSFSASVFRREVKLGDSVCRENRPGLLPCAPSQSGIGGIHGNAIPASPKTRNSQGYERANPRHHAHRMR